MIVIKTANGDRFINEAEVKSVNHKKKETMVVITYKNGSYETAYQVESMYYTNKADTEIRDYGLMLGSVITDKEFWQERAKSAEDFVKRLLDRRNELEKFINNVAKHPDSDPEYRARFIERMREEWNNRPQDELQDYRNLPYWRNVNKESRLKGDEAEKEFIRMTKEIEEQRKWAERYREAGERIMKRGLWARIINKKTYL